MKHNLLKRLPALFLCVLMLLPMAAQAGQLISIIVADTKDSSIGDSVQRDFTNMQSKTAEIAKYTKLKEVKIHLRESSATADRINKALNEISVNKDDVIIFFYAGHSYHPSSKKSTPWPTIVFSSSSKSLPYDNVIKTLENKKPRLLLTIADSCNHFLSRDAEERYEARASKADSYVLEHNYKQLFLDTSGKILVVSASPGESSWGGKSGGIFTNAFLSKLNAAVESHNGIDWKDILKDASKKTTQSTSNKNSPQHPYYEVKLKS